MLENRTERNATKSECCMSIQVSVRLSIRPTKSTQVQPISKYLLMISCKRTEIQLHPMSHIVLMVGYPIYVGGICKRTDQNEHLSKSECRMSIQLSISPSVRQSVHLSNRIQPISKCLLMISCTRVEIQLHSTIATNSGLGFSDIWWDICKPK